MKPSVAEAIYGAILGVVWLILQPGLTVANVLIGYVIGFAVVRATRHFAAGSLRVRRPAVALRLMLEFLRELALSTLQVAVAVMRPRLTIRPAFIVVPITLTDDLSITILANMITLTPGTLTLDIAPDRSALYVHCLSADDVEAVRAHIKRIFEQPIAEALECSTSPLL